MNNTFDVSTPPESGDSAFGVWADADGTTIRGNSFTSQYNASSVYSTGNETVIRDNDILHPNPKMRGVSRGAPSQYHQRPAIQVGAAFCFENQRSEDCSDTDITTVSRSAGHDWATGNVVAGTRCGITISWVGYYSVLPPRVAWYTTR